MNCFCGKKSKKVNKYGMPKELVIITRKKNSLLKPMI